MPQLNITINEAAGSGGVPTGTGNAFIAGLFDAGPPPFGPSYVECQSLAGLVAAFGPRSSASAVCYDWAWEYFQDGGQVLFVTRVTDNTATSATVTLNDGETAPKPTILVTAATPGLEGNQTTLTVGAGTGPTFTATTASNTTLSVISSFANIGAGTLVTGTGIPANTYLVSVNPGASTAVLSQAATASASGVTITPGTFTVTVTPQDSSGNAIATETHGPFYTTAQLFADTSSQWVTFTQSAGSGNTVYLPSNGGTVRTLTGGANASDITDTSYVNALANFPPNLGPGTVSLPGRTSATAWSGLVAHAAANNRFAVLDMVDRTTSAAVISDAAALPSNANNRASMFIQGSCQLPPLVAGVARTCAGSAAVAGLRAQVAQTANQNQTPAGPNWALTGPIGFTTSFPLSTTGGGNFSQSDVNAFDAAGINCFANVSGALCLYGMVTPVSRTTDATFWQFQAGVELMNLVYLLNQIGTPFIFQDIGLPTLNAFHTNLAAALANEQANGALYAADGNPGFVVDTDTPVNTPATAQAGQLNANVGVRLTKGADYVNLTLTVTPITQQINV